MGKLNVEIVADIDADDTDSHTIETDEDEDEVSSEKKISIDLSVDSGVNIDGVFRYEKFPSLNKSNSHFDIKTEQNCGETNTDGSNGSLYRLFIL